MPSRLFFAVLFLILPVTAAAQTSELMTLNDVQRGQLLFRTVDAGRYAPAPLVATEVDIAVGGIVARTVVKQHFFNPTDNWLEGRYVFPLPENASVHAMTMTTDERVHAKFIVSELDKAIEADDVSVLGDIEGFSIAVAYFVMFELGEAHPGPIPPPFPEE